MSVSSRRCDEIACLGNYVIDNFLKPKHPMYELLYVKGEADYNDDDDEGGLVIKMRKKRLIVQLVTTFRRDIPPPHTTCDRERVATVFSRHLQEDCEMNADGMAIINTHIANGKQFLVVGEADCLLFLSMTLLAS
jgi:hypothetical protein